MPGQLLIGIKIKSCRLTAARIAVYGICVSGLVSCNDVDTAQVTVECDKTNLTAQAADDCAVAIPAVRNTDEPRLRDQILDNVVKPPEKKR